MSPVFGHGRLRLYLLKLLDESPRHGYDVIRELEDRFMGLYSPSAGTVYPRLARLEAEGLVTHEVTEGRKVYQITDAGRLELGRAAERPGRPGAGDLRLGARPRDRDPHRGQRVGPRPALRAQGGGPRRTPGEPRGGS